MIFFYSATGNSRYAAEYIARFCGEKTVSVADAVRGGQFSYELRSGERLGIVAPVHFWGIPEQLRTFLEKLSLRQPKEGNYTFTVLTYGSSIGGGNLVIENIMKKKGIRVNAFYAVKMPDTWTPVFDRSEPKRDRTRMSFAASELQEMAPMIRGRICDNFVRARENFVFSPAVHRLMRAMQSTRRFRVSDACTGCGKCVRECPAGVLELKDGKPSWKTKECDFCLHCLHTCPQFAVSYGKATLRHGQYYNRSASDFAKNRGAAKEEEDKRLFPL